MVNVREVLSNGKQGDYVLTNPTNKSDEKASGHLVEWEHIDLRISGCKLQQNAAKLLHDKQAPFTDLKLDFLDGSILVAVKVQKGIPVTVQFRVAEITARGTTLEIKIDNVSTFGILPIPKLIFRLVGELNLPDGLSFDADTMKVVIHLDRLLPALMEVTVDTIRMIEGGLVVRLGEGGAL